jgi:16S rRNA (cytosine967-C5)-methyltransferase
MRPGARIQAAIELLAAIETGAAPADRTVDAYFRRRRYAGAGDRAAVTDLVYGVLRHRAELDWRVPGAEGEEVSAAARRRTIAALACLDGSKPEAITALFDGAGHAPEPLDSDERALLDAVAAGP